MSVTEGQRGTRAFKERWSALKAFWRERRRGLYGRSITEWRISEGLTARTARENYWDAGEELGIIKVVFEKKRKFWEYCDSSEAENVDSETPFMDYVRLEKVNEVRRKIGRRPLKELKKHEQTMAEEKRGTAVRREENRKETLRAK